MGNALCAGRQGPPAAGARAVRHSSSLSRRSGGSTTSGGRASLSPSRISSGLRKVSSRMLGWGGKVNAAGAAANQRFQLEERLAEVIQAKAAGGGAGRPTVSFNRLLLRFPSLHEGFAQARAVFRELAGGEGKELTLEQMRGACGRLGYHLDAAALRTIFTSLDADGSSTLNVHEFLAVLAILHILKGPEDEEEVPAAVLATWRTAEDAFLCCDSARQGYLDKGELLAMMHESATDGVRHCAGGRGGDPIQSIAARRFEELDRDKTGRVSFLQFLFCLEHWVEDAEEAAEEEEQQQQQQQQRKT